MSVLADYLPTYTKRQSNMDSPRTKNIVKKIVKVLQFIKVKLQQGRKLVEESDTTISYSEFIMLFEGVRLGQQCIQLLENDLQDITELSQIIESFEVPFLAFLKTEASSITDVNIDSLFKMATTFIGAICSSLSAQKDCTEKIKVILKAIYSVLDLVLTKNHTSSIKEMKLVIENWVQTLSKPQHFALVECIMELADNLTIPSKNDDDVRSHYIFMLLVYILLIKSTDDQKRHLRNMISVLVLKVSIIVGTTTQVEVINQTLNLLNKLTSSNIYVLQVYDVSIMLTSLLQILYPSSRDILQTNMNKSIAQSIFEMVCQVLSNIALHHRDSLSDVMGPLVSILQSLLHCFKSTQVSLVSHTKINNKKRKNVTENSTTINTSPTSSNLCTLASYAPFDSSSAEKYARICGLLVTKSNGTKRSDLTYQNIIKHVPYLLLAYFLIQSDVSMNITAPSLKTALSFGWYDLLNACSNDDRDMIMVGLNPTGQALFKSFYKSWRTDHKYTGQ
ncbi:Urb2/Npa2 family-domain-containing protein [Cunninghamella echinulata]|nr:Urb2/Npa2 family-domain-containing protein [Cunninghamella echinulata]